MKWPAEIPETDREVLQALAGRYAGRLSPGAGGYEDLLQIGMVMWFEVKHAGCQAAKRRMIDVVRRDRGRGGTRAAHLAINFFAAQNGAQTGEGEFKQEPFLNRIADPQAHYAVRGEFKQKLNEMAQSINSLPSPLREIGCGVASGIYWKETASKLGLDEGQYFYLRSSMVSKLSLQMIAA